MEKELQRQGRALSMVNSNGQIEAAGRIDLAHLAYVTEKALYREFDQ